MPWKKSARPRRRRNYKRTRGPGRGYRPGVSKFGRIAQPEIKHVLLTGRDSVAANSLSDLTIFPTVEQGIGENQRIGNRIASKFLSFRMVCSQARQPDAALPQSPAVLRYVFWKNKDPTSNANSTLSGLTLISFINTKTVQILKTGYITLSSAGTAKVFKINHKCYNKVINFKEDSDITANTSERMYFTFFSSEPMTYQFMSKFYFSDP